MLKIGLIKRKDEFLTKFAKLFNDEESADFVVECPDRHEFKVDLR